MITETEGIVLRQVKTLNSRKMLLLFSKKFGKISAGAGFTEKGKGKSALAMRPFTLAQYELFKGRESYSVNRAQAIKSYYKIGEDIDKYMASAFILEWTEHVLHQDEPAPAIYKLLIDFFDEIVERKKDYETLIIAYQIKVIKIMGCMPELDNCSDCGKDATGKYFCVDTGGILCKDCYKKNREKNNGTNSREKLIYDVKFDIVNTLKFFEKKPLSALRNIGLKYEVIEDLKKIIGDYSKYHLDVKKTKSEIFLRKK